MISKKIRKLVEEREHKRGILVAFEGPDGSGKTTQRKLFKDWLKQQGHQVVTTKWNSSKLIKPLVKARKSLRALSPSEFCLLHAADFRHRLENDILPALWEGKVVIADRYLFTALARDVVRGMELHWVLNAYAPLFWPDMVFYFSVSPETSGRRIAAERTPSFYESGQDITDIDNPHESYQKFIGDVIGEYNALSHIFDFMTLDAEKPIYDQHREIRQLFQSGKRRSWSEFNLDAIADWLAYRPEYHDAR
ncbi:MAG: dTMP kinase [Acidobacteria bacterium]|nr:dTMP kinase [Acidobacteriota bacterium]